MKAVIIIEGKQYNIDVEDITVGEISLGDLVKKVGALESSITKMKEDFDARERRLVKKWEKIK